VADDPGLRLRDIAAAVGITERAAHRIVSDLVDGATSYASAVPDRESAGADPGRARDGSPSGGAERLPRYI